MTYINRTPRISPPPDAFQIGPPTQRFVKPLPPPVLLIARCFSSLKSEVVGVFLGNGTTRQYVTVPYSRVVTSTGSSVQDEVTLIETDMVSGYYL